MQVMITSDLGERSFPLRLEFTLVDRVKNRDTWPTDHSAEATGRYRFWESAMAKRHSKMCLRDLKKWKDKCSDLYEGRQSWKKQDVQRSDVFMSHNDFTHVSQCIGRPHNKELSGSKCHKIKVEKPHSRGRFHSQHSSPSQWVCDEKWDSKLQIQTLATGHRELCLAPSLHKWINSTCTQGKNPPLSSLQLPLALPLWSFILQKGESLTKCQSPLNRPSRQGTAFQFSRPIKGPWHFTPWTPSQLQHILSPHAYQAIKSFSSLAGYSETHTGSMTIALLPRIDGLFALLDAGSSSISSPFFQSIYRQIRLSKRKDKATNHPFPTKQKGALLYGKLLPRDTRGPCVSTAVGWLSEWTGVEALSVRCMLALCAVENTTNKA